MKKTSKALNKIRAILIVILIASLAILLYYKIENKLKNINEEKVSDFNSKLTIYIGESITGLQVNSLFAYSLANNMEATQNNENYKCITITSNGGYETIIDENSTSYEKVATNETYYTVIGMYDDNGLITRIDITKNN